MDADFNKVPVNDVFIGMVQYQNLEAYERIQRKFWSQKEFQDFSKTFDVQCFDIQEVFQNDHVLILLPHHNNTTCFRSLMTTSLI